MSPLRPAQAGRYPVLPRPWSWSGDVAQLARAPALQAGGRGFESHRLHDLRLDRDFLGPAGASAATDRNQQWISRIARPGVDPTVRVESENPGSKRARLVAELATLDRVGPPSVTAELAAAGRDLERLRRAREDLDRGAGRWTHTRPAEPPTDSARHVKNARPPSNVHARRCGDANSATGAASPVSRPQRNAAPTTTGPPTRRRSPRNSTVGSPAPNTASPISRVRQPSATTGSPTTLTLPTRRARPTRAPTTRQPDPRRGYSTGSTPSARVSLRHPRGRWSATTSPRSASASIGSSELAPSSRPACRYDTHALAAATKARCCPARLVVVMPGVRSAHIRRLRARRGDLW